MKKVLIISSSPRRGGNSDVLCDEFMKGALEAGNDVEKIFLKDKRIDFCNGCGVCNTTHKCVIKDDMAEIMEKMINADVIVMATPIYFYTLSAQLKVMIDRTVPRYTEIVDKDFYYIMTAADSNIRNFQRTVEAIRGYTEGCLNNAHEKGIIYGTGVWQKDEVKSTPLMKEAYEMGKKVK